MQGRRQILKAGLAGAAVAVPAVASAQQTFNWKMPSAYGKGAPFYMDGPGSATDLARRIADIQASRAAESIAKGRWRARRRGWPKRSM